MNLSTFKALVESNDELDWLVEGLLPNEGSTLFSGPPGAGKSFFCLQLVKALQDGVLFLGRMTKQVNCLYVQADTPYLMWKEQVRRVSKNGLSRTVYNVDRGFLDNEKNGHILHALVWGKHPRALGLQFDFIVFDSLNALTSRDINTKHGMQILRTLNYICSAKSDELDEEGDQKTQYKPYLIVHHPKKEKARGVNAPSGYTEIASSCATLWTLASSILAIEKCKVTDRAHIEMERDRNGLWYIEGFENKEEEDFNVEDLELGD